MADIKTMDPRLYRLQPVGRSFALLDMQLTDRISYDAGRNILFINFQGYAIHSMEEVDSVRRVLNGDRAQGRAGGELRRFCIDEVLSDAVLG